MKRKALALLIGICIAIASGFSYAFEDLEDLIPRMEISSTEVPALPENLITQEEIQNGKLKLRQIRKRGMKVFTSSFNRLDGYGDGSFDQEQDPTHFGSGNRPGIQTSYTPFLRVNGLDAQTCVECHSVLSRSVVPPTFAVGGHGGSNNSPIFQPTEIDVNAYDEMDATTHPYAVLNGRFINPPFLFGAGGIELLAKEMTEDLQAIKANCMASGGTHELVTKGVAFGTIACAGDDVSVDIDARGKAIDEDLVVRPFGRKGEFASVRAFDRDAMQFHFGMQPEEAMADPGDDGDGDGVVREVTVGEISALSIFLCCMPAPRAEKLSLDAMAGLKLFRQIGCAECHIPMLRTESRRFTQAFPEVETNPKRNVFMNHKLFGSSCPTKFQKASGGGLKIALFADLKRHYMGELLEESAAGLDGKPLPLNGHFTTARLWGASDTAPYLHDGRAQTLTEAVLFHGGEAEDQRQRFKGLVETQRKQILDFLRSLRVPRKADVRRALR